MGTRLCPNEALQKEQALKLTVLPSWWLQIDLGMMEIHCRDVIGMGWKPSWSEWVWVLSKFNGTSTPKGSSAKTDDNDCNVNSSHYSLSTALCESIRYQAKSEQNVWTKCLTRPDTQGAPRGGCSHETTLYVQYYHFGTELFTFGAVYIIIRAGLGTVYCSS